jgi:hypothetical protein
VQGWFERRRASLTLAALVLLATASGWLAYEAQAQEIRLKIELDAFSGRPNPVWELGEQQTAEFLTRLRSLAAKQGSYSLNEGLGYRGFIVAAQNGRLDGYDGVRVYGGTVLARRGDRTEMLSDPGRALERWLLESARGHVDEPVLLQYVESEIRR